MGYANKEDARKYMRIYNQLHKDRLKKYNEDHKIEKKEYNKLYYEKNKDAEIQRARKYAKDNIQIIREKRRLLKHNIIIILGGKCQYCGIEYNGNNGCIFDTHHTNPKEKDFDINRIRNWKKIEQEIKKCDLVCSNCHRLIHFKKDKENGVK
jgi:predicted HNH restriction endonuclease